MTFRDIISSATAQRAPFLLKGLTGVEGRRGREGAGEVKSEYWWGKLHRCSMPTQQNIDAQTHTHKHTHARPQTVFHEERAGDSRVTTYSLFSRRLQAADRDLI